MLFNTSVAIALKNSVGQYGIRQITLFQLEKINTLFDNFQAKVVKNKDIVFKVKCPLCGQYHYYRYNFYDLMKREMVIGGCENLGVPVFFIGKEDKVIEKVNKYIEVNKKICAML
ncbi:MAG: hypothetical protein Q8936_03110 [Bacillota bacterium]|nr:hypothetical protein [Bacillota bacterium]